MRLLQCVRQSETGPESEPVTLEVEDGVLVLTLDDGEEIHLNLRDFRAALETESLADQYGTENAA